LKVTESTLENQRYSIELNDKGDVASIVDKKLNKELLNKPLRLAFKTDKPRQWPAWNMDWSDQQKAPRSYVDGPAKIRITENGPARVALEVTREAEGSKFAQTVRLSAGDGGDRVEFGNVIDWKSTEANLKATFPLKASNSMATYNWDIGTVERGNNDEKKFEVPSHQWFDLTDRSGTFGVTILSDCKYGSDKPDDSTLQLTLLRTPGISARAGYPDQSTQDWGHHEFVYGLASHAGDWRSAQTDWHAQRLNQPLIAFRSPRHSGKLGKSFSILRTNTDRVRVLALKQAEDNESEVIVRIVELDGRPAPNVRIGFGAKVIAAREVNGQELPVGRATISAGQLVTSLDRYQPRTFAVQLARPSRSIPLLPPGAYRWTLPYDLAVATNDGDRSTAGFDGAGRSLPAELLPERIVFDSVNFELAPAGSGKLNAVVARGQTLPVPANTRRIYVIAAAAGDDQKVSFGIGDQRVPVVIQSWNGFIGQWDNRDWKRTEVSVQPRAMPSEIPADIATILQRSRTRVDPYGDLSGITPGFIKRAPIAWYASHLHTADGKNEAYAYSYLFAYSFDVPANAKRFTLPDNDRVRILAISSTNEVARLEPAFPLYDTLER
jgi:alpha-mannosidase